MAAGRVKTALYDLGALVFVARLVAAARADMPTRHNALAFTPAMLAGRDRPAFNFSFMAAFRYYLCHLNIIHEESYVFVKKII